VKIITLAILTQVMSENPVISSREARLDLRHGRFPAYTLFHMFVIFSNSVYIGQQSRFFKIGKFLQQKEKI